MAFNELKIFPCAKAVTVGRIPLKHTPSDPSLFLLWSPKGYSRLLWAAAGKPVVLAEPAGEGDGSAEGGRPGPVGFPRLHRAHPDTHLRPLAPFHPMQGVEWPCHKKPVNLQFSTKAGVLGAGERDGGAAGWLQDAHMLRPVSLLERLLAPCLRMEPHASIEREFHI